MAIEVLQVKAQIEQARDELRNRGLSCMSSKIVHLANRLGFHRWPVVGDATKSWDVLKSATFIEKNIAVGDPILDIGSFASEILCILHRLGYNNLTGLDLNPQITHMPFADSIRYVISDFMHTPFENGAFHVITSISVIEHGFNCLSLLSEISRLLRPGGYFIASFDYWPQKIDTAGIRPFGMDWSIFSEQDIHIFLRRAEEYGLSCIGDSHFTASEPTVSWQGKSYTFAWLSMQKRG
ncbi:MAG TPA: class I SAM-dependent methyltransferase [Nitrospirota bacterium]|nr:class I SAM-dependent methyltransferase [Nitrospirota bacterium]HUL00822.1 class I SAM-dependent methyltransferase [Nitrospirota bacterium]